MASPPPHGTSLGVWKAHNKIAGVSVTHVDFFKGSTGTIVSIPMTREEAEYFVVGQSYSFSATQP
jgi:hypothetical protein